MAATSSTGCSPPDAFHLFARLPPEIRHCIWQAALPASPSVNFFNIHTWPNSHAGCTRSASPPHLYLDVRRLDIDDDDATVATYDPSAWQARYALRQACREARRSCALPAAETLSLKLARPARGMFVRPGDGLQRAMTPYFHPTATHLTAVSRTLQLHKDDMVVLSIDNCSFCMHDDMSAAGAVKPAFPPDFEPDTDDDPAGGWAFDPAYHFPIKFRNDRVCIGLTRYTPEAEVALTHEVVELMTDAMPPDAMPDLEVNKWSLMWDASTGRADDILSGTPFFWDRWDDRYAFYEDDDQLLMRCRKFLKLLPEKSDVRRRYVASTRKLSPKRPAGAP